MGPSRSTRTRPSRRAWRWLAALLAVPLLTVATGLPAAAAQAPPGAEELNSRIEPAVVLLGVTWSGYVLYDTADGRQWSDPLESSTTCTGFFVSTTGQIATAGHCVDPDEGRALLIDALLDQQVDRKLLTSAQASSISPGAQQSWQVEGRNTGSPIARTITAVQPSAVTGAALTRPAPAQMLAFQPGAEGDLALLKVETTGAVALPVATADPRSGAPLTAIGFPGTVRAVSDIDRTRASFISGTVASNQVTPQGVATTEIDATINPGMSGGPTVDELGNVLGVNSFYVRDTNGVQASNFVTDTTSLHDWLGAHGVTTLPPAVAPAGDGPPAVPTWVWYAAGAAVLVLALLALAVVVRGRRRPADSGGAAPAWAVPAQRTGETPAPAGTGPAAPPPGSPAPAAAAEPAAPAEPAGLPEPTAETTDPAATGAPDAGTTAPVSTLERPTASWCGACGARAGAGARFCTSCGTAVG